MFEIKNPEINQKIVKKYDMKSLLILGKSGKLAKEFLGKAKSKGLVYDANSSINPSRSYMEEIYQAYFELCGVKADTIVNFDDFWNAQFDNVFVKLLGKHDARTVRDLCFLVSKSPYTQKWFRPSYRSSAVHDYVDAVFTTIIYSIRFFMYDIKIVDIIKNDYHVEGFEYQIALALKNDDKEVCDIITEAILGESKIKLSFSIINGVIKSDVPKHLENLGKLLLAAKGQEGVRQFILENADLGSIQAHAYFIKLIIDNNLVRFSSVIRAFATWTGLAFDNAKPTVVKKCVELAHHFLTITSERIEDELQSSDTLELYMAIWANASHDINAARNGAEYLVCSGDKYKRLVGWYFLSGAINPKITHELAIHRIADLCNNDGKEELAWVCTCLYRGSSMSTWHWNHNHEQEGKTITAVPDIIFSDDKAIRHEQFNILCGVIKFIGNKKTKFEGSIFPWAKIQLDSANVSKCLLGLVGYDLDSGMIQELYQYVPLMDSDSRRAFYTNHLNPKIKEQRSLLLQGLSDKSTYTRGNIVSQLEKEVLNSVDIDYLTATLTTQNAGLRKAIMTLLERQDDSLILPMIDTLLNSGNIRQIAAAEELQAVFGLVEVAQDVIATEFLPENGFGLFNPHHSDFNIDSSRAKRPEIKIFSRNDLATLLKPAENDWGRIVTAIKKVIADNVGREVETVGWDGRKFKVLIGNDTYNLPLLPDIKQGKRNHIGDFHLGTEILQAFDSLNISPLTMAVILCYGHYPYRYTDVNFTNDAKEIFSTLPLEEKELDYDKYGKPYSALIRNIMDCILQVRCNGVFEFAMSVWKSLVVLIPESKYMTDYEVVSQQPYYYQHTLKDRYNGMLEAIIVTQWRTLATRFIETDKQFADFWNESWFQYIATDRKFPPGHGIFDHHILRAHKLGLLSIDGLYHELLLGVNATDHIRHFTAGNRYKTDADRQIFEEKYPFFADVLHNAVNRIVDVEKNRGELPTPISEVAAQIGYFRGGAEHFAGLLSALGKDNFYRGYNWYGTVQTKNSVLSLLMRNCYPLDTDTAVTFDTAIKSAKIQEKRLLQAIMYAPQWADFAEKSMGIAGLASAVWLFHAHVNEQFNAEKETRIALYSTVSQQEFTDGAFDKDWFLQAYNAVGDEVFGELYKNAKYITAAANNAHRRSQLYTDAVLGKLDKKELKETIEEKRGQNALQAYALIPLDKRNKSDALQRYEFIQKYLKESKQFGSQRRASEGKAVMVALRNLAITTGFGDAARMSWYLESEKMETLASLMEVCTIGECDVRLVIAEDGTPSIEVAKSGKTLKSIPASIKKHEKVMEIQTAIKDLREQKSRAKSGFEMAMVSRTEFTVKEIQKLLNHAVLKSMVETLVFVSDSHMGFAHEIIDKLKEEDTIIIAHPHDFIKKKNWSDYQQYLYKNKIIQPFKQVFREYYPVTADELAEVNISRRYAGHQVQPKKTTALLKTRGWTVDHYEGLQRVYHKHNLVAKMYAAADWFTPSEIEAPTLEVIRFYSRDKFEPIAFEEVPPVIFSEVMRDIDLVVSVAHIGGVDPEASHSTVEMRVAIARELLALLSVSNVTFQDEKTSHALISGSMGDYSVHMGSGLIYQSGVGMIAVTAVHSQARGRIFLPFADDDPRTAEIMSKILLFADDKKIKDPAILAQVKRN